MKMYVRLLGLCCMIGMLSSTVEAKVTFLPDWMASDMDVGYSDFGDDDVNQDDKFCEESGLYHEADDCPAPQIFDEYCPFDDEWISECYCPSVFNKTCTSPYRGDERKTDERSGYANCGDKWIACCDTTCPLGTSVNNAEGCDGYELNACGNKCFYPYRAPLADETDCEYGTEECSDDCGGTRLCCKDCTKGEDVDASTCEYGTKTCTDECGGTYTCCKDCTKGVDVDPTTCENGTTTCTDECGNTYTCCKDCTKGVDVDTSTCDYGTKTCTDECGGTYTCCKSCEDNGGSSSCTGQTSKCGENQTEVSTCVDCLGTTLYTCEEDDNGEKSCADSGYKDSVPDGNICMTTTSNGLTCYTNCKETAVCGTGVVASGDTVAYDTSGKAIALLYNNEYYVPKSFSCGGRTYSDTLQNIADNSQYVLPPYTLNDSINKLISVTSYWTSTQCGSTSHITGTGSCTSDTTQLSCTVGLLSCSDDCPYKGNMSNCDNIDTTKYTCNKEECSGKYYGGCNTSYYNSYRASLADSDTCSEGTCAEVCTYDSRYYKCSADACSKETGTENPAREFTLYINHSMPWGSCSGAKFSDYNFFVGFYTLDYDLVSSASVTIRNGGQYDTNPITQTFSNPIPDGEYIIIMKGSWTGRNYCDTVYHNNSAGTADIYVNGTTFEYISESGEHVTIVSRNAPSVTITMTFGAR